MITSSGSLLISHRSPPQLADPFQLLVAAKHVPINQHPVPVPGRAQDVSERLSMKGNLLGTGRSVGTRARINILITDIRAAGVGNILGAY